MGRHLVLPLLVACAALLVASAEAQCTSGPPLGTANVIAWNCNPTAVGSNCTATCKTGYTSPNPPKALCQAAPNTWGPITGECKQVCTGNPNNNLLTNGGTWPDSCKDATPTGSVCTSTCPNGGATTITCVGSSWYTPSLTGSCFSTPGPWCPATNTPVSLANTVWNCAATPVGQVCTGTCNAGTSGPAPPTVACVADANSPSGGSWATTATGTCQQVCLGVPTYPLTNSGTWPGSCNNAIRPGDRCFASCPYGGDASIACATVQQGFANYTFTGTCYPSTPTCVGTPVTNLTNGVFTCTSAPVGSTCQATCNQGNTANGMTFGGPFPPEVKCNANATSPSGGSWDKFANGTCKQVCLGAPPSNLLTAGSWPSSCTNATIPGGTCAATCPYGSATITCGSTGWASSTMVGQCSNTPVCTGLPVAAPDARWPNSCNSQGIGYVCPSTCRANYTGGPAPISTCAWNATSGTAYWTNPNPDRCVFGQNAPDVAFVVSEDTNEVLICDLKVPGNTFANCFSNNGAVGAAASTGPFVKPVGIAVVGSQVWITEDTVPSRVRVCSWYGRSLTTCVVSTALGGGPALNGTGEIVVDTRRNVAFTAIDNDGCISTCRDIDTMTQCDCTDFPDVYNEFPVGLALTTDHLWISSLSGVYRCDLVPQYNVNAEIAPPQGRGYDNSTCVLFNITVGPIDIEPYGIMINETSGKIWLGDYNSGKVVICNVTGTPPVVQTAGPPVVQTSSCISSTGDNTFGSPASGNRLPAYAGLAEWDGYLYTPLRSGGGNPVSLCTNKNTATGCALRPLTFNPARNPPVPGSVNIAFSKASNLNT